MQRKLAAILSADVVGYSGLMEADEAGTLERLKENRRAIFDPCVARHSGRIVKLMGDGALVEFASVVAAVECAVALQVGTASAPNQSIRYRIGVNLGDVIVEGDDIYGDGVNVAARLQTLAPEGGVAISRTVRDHIDGKMAATFRDLGEHVVKNIQKPVHVFALEPPGRGLASVRKRGAEQSRLAICVLPFANMSGDLEQEYFSDGISEDIITDLSKVSTLAVTARNTAFTFKGTHVDVVRVARQLNVGHVLEGSVRKSGNRVRITAQLIDGKTGDHVWAERYDRDMGDIFALQDQISEAIVAALRLKLLPEEKEAIERRGTNDPEAYRIYLMARQYGVTGNVGVARRSEGIIRLCQQAIKIDPNYARAWALMAIAQSSLRYFVGRAGDDGWDAAERALALDPTLAEAYAAKCRVLTYKRQLDEAMREAENALQRDSESYEVNRAVAHVYYAGRRFPEAIRYWEKATELVDSDYIAAGMLVSCYTAIGDQEGARHAAQRCVERTERIVAAEPDNGSAMGHLIGSLALLGEGERAKAWADRALVLDPNNGNMRYNIACCFVVNLNNSETALNLLRPYLETVEIEMLNWVKNDPDMDPVREDPRFKAMIAAAETRLAQSKN